MLGRNGPADLHYIWLLSHSCFSEMSSHGERNSGQHGREPTQQNNNLDGEVLCISPFRFCVIQMRHKDGRTQRA